VQSGEEAPIPRASYHQALLLSDPRSVDDSGDLPSPKGYGKARENNERVVSSNRYPLSSPLSSTDSCLSVVNIACEYGCTE
jgi:hypothetical protein